MSENCAGCSCDNEEYMQYYDYYGTHLITDTHQDHGGM